ncbi:MAG: LPXTG cell wall anchor domain-containing protein, partial [Neisseria sp.]|nr:LPXTG cell wall anchor domain-containing protein [Neisseria sp.]
QDKGNTSSQDGTSSERPQTTDQANQQGASQVGTTSNVAGQVVQNVTAEAPVETATGVSIVSTKEGKVVLSDGSEVSPETVGARTNEDKTITVTKKDGSKVTLPHTGDAKTLVLSFLGTLMAFTGALIWKQKKVQDN